MSDHPTLASRLSHWRTQGVRHIKIGFTDVDGVLRGKYLSMAKAEGIAAGVGGFCDCVFGWDINDQLYDNASVTGWHTGFPDAAYRILPETERWLAEENAPFYLAEFVDGAAAPHAVCPRSRLASVIARCESLGYRAQLGYEYEFFVFAETPHSAREKGYSQLTPLTPGNFGYSVLRTLTEAELFQGLLDLCESLDCPIEGLHCETGPGVWEAAISYSAAMSAADRAVLFKTFTKAFFQRRDLMATFMAKWSMDYPGQSGHVHVSLTDLDGNPVFHDSGDSSGISAIQRHFVGGLQRYLPELLPLVAPTINSFSRLVPGAWAPTAATWGVENRTCGIRVVPGSQRSQRVEVRVPAADANPYLVASATLAAGLAGLEEAIAPTAPVVGNAYEVQAELPETLQFAPTLRAATEQFRGSAVARQWLGDVFVDHFAASRDWESREYEKTVTNWQLERYFEIV